jgi:hypothetical protein
MPNTEAPRMPSETREAVVAPATLPDAEASPAGSGAPADPRAYSVAVVGAALICFALACFQPLGVGRDFAQYDGFWNGLRGSGLGSILESRFEPAFAIVSWTLALVVTSNQVLHGILAAASIAAKLSSVRALAPDEGALFAAVAFAAIRFVPLHELTQIRAALALAALLGAFAARRSGARTAATVLCLLAPAFHVSAALAAPFIWASPARRRDVLVYAALAFAVARFAVPWAIGVAIGEDLGAFAVYELEFFEPVNPLSAVVVLDLGVIAAAFVLWRSVSGSMKQVILLQCVGLALFWATMDHPVFAHRVREAFSAFWLFFVAEAYGAGGTLRTVSVVFTVVSSAAHLQMYRGAGAEDPFFD